jgi:hypothetical protein
MVAVPENEECSRFLVRPSRVGDDEQERGGEEQAAAHGS